MMKCNNCNAALSADQMRGEDCPFCGVALQHRAEAIKAAARVKEILRDSDGDGVPDVFGDAESIQARADQQAELEESKANPRAAVIACVFIFLLVGGLGLFFDTNDPLKLGTQDLKQLTEKCVVQSNGDETLDVAVFAQGTNYDGARIVIYDGKDGSQLFKSQRLENASGMHCFDESTFLVRFSDFRQQIYLPSQPEESLEFLGSDAIRSLGKWRDCVTVQTTDGASQSYSLARGEISDCEVADLKQVHISAPNMLRSAKKKVGWKRGSVRTSLATVEQGSPRLRVTYKGEGETSWEKTLDFLKPNGSSAIETFPGRVMLWGASLGKRDECFLIALDDKTGEQIYAVPFAQPFAPHLSFFSWNGDHLLVGFGGGLWAIDPATGETVWKRGTTGMGRVIDASKMGRR